MTHSAALNKVSTPLAARGAMPELALRADWSGKDPISALVVPIFQGKSGVELAGGPLGLLSSEQEIELWKLLVSVGAQGEKGELTTVPGALTDSDATEFTTGKIIAVGLGDVESISEEDVREAAGEASRALRDAETIVSTLGMFGAEAALVGHALGAYSFRGMKSGQDSDTTPQRITVLAHDVEEDSLPHAEAVVSSIAVARDLVNQPANVLFPASYAEAIKAFGEAVGLKVEILDEAELEAQGFGGIVGVGQGSTHPPRLVRVSHSPKDAKGPKIALVGKGVTFDTGGISLKPGANMWNMISDMGGSAAVVGTMLAAAQLEVPLNITATIPLAENMPGGNAIRPGDVLRHYGGKTTEVLNTDAEGRLILADAIARACEDEPDFLIETATLTGAQLVALGDRTPGIMGSTEFRDRVAMVSQRVGENGWPMPLPLELGEALKSDVADLQNISTNRWGGMSVAGHYLSNFVADGVQWVHIDVAGPAYNTGAPHGYTPKRGTGVPLRTMLATIESLIEK